MITAVAAVFIGLCALVVSIYQVQIMRQQQRELSEQRRAEVWPHLEFGKGEYGREVRFMLVNTGVGPARIERVQVRLNGAPLSTWTALLDSVLKRERYSYSQSQMSGRVLPAGDEIVALVVADTLFESVGPEIEAASLTFCYCSVYADCWEYTLGFDGETTRETVQACPATPDDFLQ